MRFEFRTTSDGSLTLFDHEAGECFKSRHAAKSECEHVFFRPAVLEHPNYRRSENFATLELGFGLGTNFLYFLENGFSGHFTTIEQDLEGARFFLQHEGNPELQIFLEQGSFSRGSFSANLIKGDFFEALENLRKNQKVFQSVLFDPFSPKANPECWTKELFTACYQILEPGGRLVTYSVSRMAKDAALAAGFEIEKRNLPGELQKRSALLAIKPISG